MSEQPSNGIERPTTIEYGVDLTVTSAFGVHRGKGYHRCRYWTPDPDSAEEAKQMLADEKGVVEVHDVKSREVPAPEKWEDDDPRMMTDGGEPQEPGMAHPVSNLDTEEPYPIYLHNVGGKDRDGEPVRIDRWTFACRFVRDVVLDHIHGRVLNGCAGKTKLDKRGCEIVRNDIDEECDADLHVDVCEIHEHFQPESFDSAILDPPFDPGRGEELYKGMHASSYIDARDSVGQLVRRGGTVIELGWNSWSLADKDGWERVEHHLYRTPFKGDVHLVVDRRVNQRRLTDGGGRDV